MANPYFSPLLLLLILLPSTTATYTVGVNYGSVANNLPPPSQVAAFLKSQRIINGVKIFDANPDYHR
ncbi:hypothetical protein RCOM_0667350 [Ricinus communis]|uniref:Uncharacterized protein n=1 Tax=Ricinus communis TaxID=3988 RepID=B9SK59_RICCO|nr:hypothetical protein RCOM_0301170 [Ricinus communis]EEF36002.1 hypothetical protein RCOM_0667350 [Ricinus communis]